MVRYELKHCLPVEHGINLPLERGTVRREPPALCEILRRYDAAEASSNHRDQTKRGVRILIDLKMQ